MSKINFGVGCWSFGLIQGDTSEQEFRELLSGSDSFKNELKSAFEAIPGLTKLKIDLRTSQGFIDAPPELVKNAIPSNFEVIYQPRVVNGKMTFSLDIPRKVQKEFDYRFIEIGTKFEVVVQFRHPRPIVFIKSYSNNSKSPSHAVFLVREFLLQHFLTSGSRVQLSNLGPSPFHCDFFLAGKANLNLKENGIKYEYKQYYHQRDDINIHWDTAFFKNQDEAFEAVMVDMLPELDLYYEIVIERNDRLRKGREIFRLRKEILEMFEQTGILYSFKRLFKSSKPMRKLSLKVARGRFERIESRTHFESQFNELYETKEVEILKPFLREELAESFPGENEETFELVQVLESRRSSDRFFPTTLFIGAISALIGAIIGQHFH